MILYNYWNIREIYQDQKVNMALASISVLFCDQISITKKVVQFMGSSPPWAWQKKQGGKDHYDMNLNKISNNYE